MQIPRMLGLAIILFLTGCSSESTKRLMYETMENVGQQECLKTMSNDCNKRQSYDEYQQQRKELETQDR